MIDYQLKLHRGVHACIFSLFCRSTVSSIGSISMASSMDRDLDEEDLDETSYERAETSDTDIDNDDSDGRGSKSEKVSSFYWYISL